MHLSTLLSGAAAVASLVLPAHGLPAGGSAGADHSVVVVAPRLLARGPSSCAEGGGGALHCPRGFSASENMAEEGEAAILGDEQPKEDGGGGGGEEGPKHVSGHKLRNYKWYAGPGKTVKRRKFALKENTVKPGYMARFQEDCAAQGLSLQVWRNVCYCG